MSDEDYIVEYTAVGNSVKVTAFDPLTLKEVSIVGATNMPRQQLAELAIRKLIYVLNKDNDSA